MEARRTSRRHCFLDRSIKWIRTQKERAYFQKERDETRIYDSIHLVIVLHARCKSARREIKRVSPVVNWCCGSNDPDLRGNEGGNGGTTFYARKVNHLGESAVICTVVCSFVGQLLSLLLW